METMMVALLIVGATFYVATMHTPVESPHLEAKPLKDQQTRDILTNYQEYPATSEYIHYTHLLEQHIIEYLRGDNDALDRRIFDRGTGDSHRLLLQRDNNHTTVLGPREHPDTIASTGSFDWVSRLGHTLIQPTISHHTPHTPVHVQALPTWINRIPTPATTHYQVDLLLEVEDPHHKDPVSYTHSTTHSYRTPHKDHNPLLITYRDAEAHPVPHYQNLGLLPNDLLHYNQTIHTLLQASNTSTTAAALSAKDIMRVHVPPGWSAILEGPDWKPLAGPMDSTWRLRYTGPPVMGEEVAWLNFTLTRPMTEPPLHHQILKMEQEGRTWSTATMLLLADTPSSRLPLSVLVSQPNPSRISVPTGWARSGSPSPIPRPIPPCCGSSRSPSATGSVSI
jgi:hypothetical protein